MNNTTDALTQPITDHHVDQFGIIFAVTQLASLLLSLAVQWAIHKAHVVDNNYQLICYSSISDSLYALTAMLLALVAILQNGEKPNRLLFTTLNFSIYLWNSLSLIISALISIDRWIAVKYCLR